MGMYAQTVNVRLPKLACRFSFFCIDLYYILISTEEQNLPKELILENIYSLMQSIC